jgi:hypothetical protein
MAVCGNTLVQSASPNSPTPIVGSVTYGGTNPVLYWRCNIPIPGEAEASTSITSDQAQSQAFLFYPSDSYVMYARLYWGATGPTPTPDTNIQLARQGAFWQSVIADDTHTLSDNRYQGTADVTSIVRQYGPGTYQVSGVDSVNTLGVNGVPFCGWSLVVIFTSRGAGVNEIVLMDGFEEVTNSAPSTTTVSRLHPIVTNPPPSRLFAFAYGGEDHVTGDRMLVNGLPQSGSIRFDSTCYTSPGDLPENTGGPGSMSGIDLDSAYIQSYLQPGATSEQIEAITELDRFILGYVAVSVRVNAPPLGCIGDADADDAVDFADITSVLANFGQIGLPFGPGDADGNGFVLFDDVTTVLANFGAVCAD